MTSDRQRREVAARLRACAQDVNGTRDFAMYLSNWVGVEGVADDEGNQFSVAADRRAAERTLEKLADLIDRPTCEDVSVPRGDVFTPYVEFKCSACGCSHVSLTYVYYCPNCGAEVVEGD